MHAAARLTVCSGWAGGVFGVDYYVAERVGKLNGPLWEKPTRHPLRYGSGSRKIPRTRPFCWPARIPAELSRGRAVELVRCGFVVFFFCYLLRLMTPLFSST